MVVVNYGTWFSSPDIISPSLQKNVIKSTIILPFIFHIKTIQYCRLRFVPEGKLLCFVMTKPQKGTCSFSQIINKFLKWTIPTWFTLTLLQIGWNLTSLFQIKKKASTNTLCHAYALTQKKKKIGKKKNSSKK